ncbi:hypothetical protein B0H14DRAFT_2637766 [Mycena olivaceomarginata]|nr:hypothetical protein B0H14DRAFT_2637766 [Mycena olivaceomarginata]
MELDTQALWTSGVLLVRLRRALPASSLIFASSNDAAHRDAGALQAQGQAGGREYGDSLTEHRGGGGAAPRKAVVHGSSIDGFPELQARTAPEPAFLSEPAASAPKSPRGPRCEVDEANIMTSTRERVPSTRKLVADEAPISHWLLKKGKRKQVSSGLNTAVSRIDFSARLEHDINFFVK